MKVWIVAGGEYEQWYLCGAFSSRERAEAFCAKRPKDRYIENDDGWEIDELAGEQRTPPQETK